MLSAAFASPELWPIIRLSLAVSLSATVAATALGLPLGAAMAVWRFPGHRALVVSANALYLLLSHQMPGRRRSARTGCMTSSCSIRQPQRRADRAPPTRTPPPAVVAAGGGESVQWWAIALVAALATAFSEAVTMSLSMPTPNSVASPPSEAPFAPLLRIWT